MGYYLSRSNLDLVALYKYQRAARVSYICLCSGLDVRGQRRLFLRDNFESVLKCLKPHSFDRALDEIKLPCGIILNVFNFYRAWDFQTIIIAPTKLLSYHNHSFSMPSSRLLFSIKLLDQAMQYEKLFMACRLDGPRRAEKTTGNYIAHSPSEGPVI